MTKQGKLTEELIKSVKIGNLEKVKYLIDNGADVNAKNRNKESALVWSSRRKHLNIVKYLVENGADVDIRDNDNDTALIWSSYKGHLEIVKYLVENGADVEIRGAKNVNALVWSSMEGHLKIVECLINNGADIGDDDTILDFIKNKMFNELIPLIYNSKFFEKIYNKITTEQKHVLFKHLMNNRELLEQVNPRLMKGFIPDINEYKNNL